MDRTSNRTRVVSVPVLAVVALLAAVLVAPGVREPAHAAGGSAAMQTTAPRALTAGQVAFHDQMRKLWEDHVTWTRLAIVTFADGSQGFDATAGRLLQNQADIGDAFKPFYGDAAGNHLTALLREHILGAVDLLTTAKAGDSAGFAAARDRWYANANQIADLISSLDPQVWPQDEMRAMMRTHLDQTLAEAADELGGHYAASVADYEPIHAHILEMADTLSSGLFVQFPSRFH
jgi:hypothetical protein